MQLVASGQQAAGYEPGCCRRLRIRAVGRKDPDGIAKPLHAFERRVVHEMLADDIGRGFDEVRPSMCNGGSPCCEYVRCKKRRDAPHHRIGRVMVSSPTWDQAALGDDHEAVQRISAVVPCAHIFAGPLSQQRMEAEPAVAFGVNQPLVDQVSNRDHAAVSSVLGDLRVECDWKLREPMERSNLRRREKPL
jgi:hypothetical protein